MSKLCIYILDQIKDRKVKKKQDSQRNSTSIPGAATERENTVASYMEQPQGREEAKGLRTK